jgi:hypothetical protein
MGPKAGEATPTSAAPPSDNGARQQHQREHRAQSRSGLPVSCGPFLLSALFPEQPEFRSKRLERLRHCPFTGRGIPTQHVSDGAAEGMIEGIASTPRSLGNGPVRRFQERESQYQPELCEQAPGLR